MFGRRAFSVAGPVAWNSLPDYLGDPTRSLRRFSSRFENVPRFTSADSALEALRIAIMHYI